MNVHSPIFQIKILKQTNNKIEETRSNKTEIQCFTTKTTKMRC
jgi:hypothetical protein